MGLLIWSVFIMIIYFKCSFKLSRGYKIGKYTVEKDSLEYVSEQSAYVSSVPEAVNNILSMQLSRSIMLLTDENGNIFLSVLRLIEGDDEKYVNAVFYSPEDPERIIALYEYFCNNQTQASAFLLNSVGRIEAVENLEYTIRNNCISDLLSKSEIYYSNKRKPNQIAPNSLISFISVDDFSDSELLLEDKFSTKKTYCINNFDFSKNEIDNYKNSIKKLYFSIDPYLYITLIVLIIILILKNLL